MVPCNPYKKHKGGGNTLENAIKRQQLKAFFQEFLTCF